MFCLSWFRWSRREQGQDRRQLRKRKFPWTRRRERESAQERGGSSDGGPEFPSQPSLPLFPPPIQPPVVQPAADEGPPAGRTGRLERELNSSRLPLVRYLPAPESSTGFNVTPTPEYLAKWAPSDIPPICIERHNACCYICLMDYEEPQLNTQLLEDPAKAANSEATEALRQLPCRHIFHQLCIDTYLQSSHSDLYVCPVCHKKVIPLTSDMPVWEAEFNLLMSSQDENEENDTSSEEDYSNGNDREELGFTDGEQHFDREWLPVPNEYIFEPNNKYLDPSSSMSPSLKNAKILEEQNGPLSEVALLLEAAIQREDLGKGDYEAWILLGENRSMDERGQAAMQALTEGVRRTQLVGATGPGMLLLATSYLNESCNKAARAMLFRWLRARFPTFPFPEDTIKAVSAISSRNLHNCVTNAFLSVARAQNRTEGIVERDLHIGLGILFSTNNESSRATASYGSALATQPEDYVLWNRVGCTLAINEDSLEAYHEAARLRPTYTRAIFNLGRTSWDMGGHKLREAAEHMLSALALQESAGGKATEELWSYLSDIFSSMGRPDLVDISKLEAQTSLEVYRREGFNFWQKVSA